MNAKRFGVGKYLTWDGRQAEVLSVTDDGWLWGRVNLERDANKMPNWNAESWNLNGECEYHYGKNLVGEQGRVIRKYWVNIYENKPGELLDHFDYAEVEASRYSLEGNAPLCRVEVNIDAQIGEGLR